MAQVVGLHMKTLLATCTGPATRTAFTTAPSCPFRYLALHRSGTMRRARASVRPMSSTGIAEVDVKAAGLAATCPRDALVARLASLERSFGAPRLSVAKRSSGKVPRSASGRALSTSPGWTPSTKPFGRRQPQRLARSRPSRSSGGSHFTSNLQLSTPGDGKEHLPRLSLEEERQLGECIQAARHLLDGSLDGQEDASPHGALLREAQLAEQVLVTRNVRLIYLVAKRLRHYSVHAEDLYAEGMVALHRAARGFDPEKGHAFATFAIPVLHRHLERAAQSLSRSIYLPSSRLIQIKKLRSMSWALERQLGRPPTVAEVAEVMQLPEQSIVELRADAQAAASLEQAGQGEEDSWVREEVHAQGLDPSSQAVRELQGISLRSQLAHLPPAECAVVLARHGMLEEGGPGMTWQELGRWMGVSANRTHQLHTAAIEKLRRNMVADQH
ncbi:hypothetical protein ACKKBG_A10595 [Auxenochlorella protothecoides x Auxenochlorella symbiontica]